MYHIRYRPNDGLFSNIIVPTQIAWALGSFEEIAIEFTETSVFSSLFNSRKLPKYCQVGGEIDFEPHDIIQKTILKKVKQHGFPTRRIDMMPANITRKQSISF